MAPEQQRPFAPMPDKATTKAADLPAKTGTVTMNFPRVVMLQRKDRSVVRFEMGIQEVPVEIINEPAYKDWLELNGAKVYTPQVRALNPSQVVITEHHVKFLQSRGYANVRSIEDAKTFIYKMTVRDAQGFFEEAAQWKGQAPNPNWSAASNDPLASGAAAAHETAKGADDDKSKPAAPAEQPATTAPAEQPAPTNDPPDKAISAIAGADQGASAADTQSGAEAANSTAAPATSAAAAPSPTDEAASAGKPAADAGSSTKGKGKK